MSGQEGPISKLGVMKSSFVVGFFPSVVLAPIISEICGMTHSNFSGVVTRSLRFSAGVISQAAGSRKPEAG